MVLYEPLVFARLWVPWEKRPSFIFLCVLAECLAFSCRLVTVCESISYFPCISQGHPQIRSDQISRSVVSDSLQPHESQHTRPPCPSPTPSVHSDSRPSSLWCHPAISSSVIPLSPFPQSIPASRSFPMSPRFASGGQSIGASASASALPVNIQDWFLLGLTGLISLQSKGLSRVFYNTTVQRHRFFNTQSVLFMIQPPHPYMTTGKTIALTIWTFASKVMSLLLKYSKFVIAFLSTASIF